MTNRPRTGVRRCIRIVAGGALLAWLALPAGAAAQTAAGEPDPPWGAPVDGLACRLRLAPRYVVGQAIAATIEIKNTSKRTRYLVPQLDPQCKDALTLDVSGPAGKVAQRIFSDSGSFASESTLKAIVPGAVERFEVADLRRYFGDLEAWQADPAPRTVDVPIGKYTARFRFRSPKVGLRLYPAQPFRYTPLEVLANHWAGEAASAPVAFEMAPLGKDDLVVHEWGVFTVFNDVKYANANRKAEWGALPSFFYRQFPKERLRWAPSAWDKPIIYFYAKATPLRVAVQVKFPEGAPVVWWPAAADPWDDWPGGILAKRPRPFRALSWEAWLGEQVPTNLGQPRHGEPSGPAPRVKVTDFPLPKDCWLNAARLAGATPLTVTGTDAGKPKPFPRMPDRFETERFLYYDGLVPTPDYLRCEAVDAASVTLRNRAKFDMARLFVVDRRGAGKVGFAVIDAGQPLKAGTARRIEPRVAAAWPAAGVKAVRRALCDAGLFAAEADALLKIWHKPLLEAEGVTAFHVLPIAEYDRMLPLRVLPAPTARPVRVGIALHPHVEIEPGLAAQVAALVRQLDEDDFARREAASKTLLEIGPLAIALLRAELNKGLPLETRRRIEAVLDRVDTTSWLNVPGKGKGGVK